MISGPILALDGVSKSYGDVLAIDDVSLNIAVGEVFALIGENGAGKSTIVKMMSGEIAPSRGTIRVLGEKVAFSSPRDALARGISVVHQHYALVPDFTVAENFALGTAPLGRLDRSALNRRIRTLAASVGVEIDPDALVGSLDVAGQQKIEILKALAREPRFLILDEPAAVLSPEDADRLFLAIERIRRQGISVVLVTHRLADVFRICDRVAVMRMGRLVVEGDVTNFAPEDLISLMMTGERGAALPSQPCARAATATAARGDTPVLQVRDLELHRANGSVAVRSMSFDLAAGEILAVAGVEGNGQTELVRSIAGLERQACGSIGFSALEGELSSHSPQALRQAGLAHVPEDRIHDGIVLTQSLAENLLLGHLHHPAFVRKGVIRRDSVVRQTTQVIQDYGIRTTGPMQPIGRLSGGNQQKLVLAREFMNDPCLLLAAHPSRGLDIRTSALVQGLLIEHRDRGAAILLVSADLDEIWAIADRVIVLSDTRMHGPVPIHETTRQEVGAWMAGH
ncbi:ABC transporter ATP-binding protein [Pseudaminobacter soli (ex Li et al. 2025)]|uniref:Heme ABC transporter ATP-binding protein n=1 Tax=Pseudaminobacter soli (ex Li et al. 2025) TaxID=1295366 RepID=A0A2P7S340_9HYPH|nr:ABC transporter ATP-binding protein [Mesorhizobium soli]PSJ56866.1 heme ABC transporter ATP-binding protein [Mesorhizobium soli]